MNRNIPDIAKYTDRIPLSLNGTPTYVSYALND